MAKLLVYLDKPVLLSAIRLIEENSKERALIANKYGDSGLAKQIRHQGESYKAWAEHIRKAIAEAEADSKL